jgi:hypothetical protein
VKGPIAAEARRHPSNKSSPWPGNGVRIDADALNRSKSAADVFPPAVARVSRYHRSWLPAGVSGIRLVEAIRMTRRFEKLRNPALLFQNHYHRALILL